MPSAAQLIEVGKDPPGVGTAKAARLAGTGSSAGAVGRGRKRISPTAVTRMSMTPSKIKPRWANPESCAMSFACFITWKKFQTSIDVAALNQCSVSVVVRELDQCRFDSVPAPE